jgi:hypothetical protein
MHLPSKPQPQKSPAFEPLFPGAIMTLARSLYLLPRGLLCASLSAQDPAPKPAEKPAEAKAESPPPKPEESKPERDHFRSESRGMHFGHSSRFWVYAQGVMPLRDLKESLEARYVVSSINKSFDANTLQASLGWHF